MGSSPYAPTVALSPSMPSSELAPSVPASQSQPGEPSAELAPGHTLGRYAILDTLGSGGMGRVYRAYDPKLRREVALKQLKVTADSSAQVRIVREAQAMAQLSHPNVISVFDVDTDGGQVFVAMEYVDGVTLREWVKSREGRWVEIVEAFVDAGQGLAAAHREDLIHRDFKPNNVLVAPTDACGCSTSAWCGFRMSLGRISARSTSTWEITPRPAGSSMRP